MKQLAKIAIIVFGILLIYMTILQVSTMRSIYSCNSNDQAKASICSEEGLKSIQNKVNVIIPLQILGLFGVVGGVALYFIAKEKKEAHN